MRGYLEKRGKYSWRLVISGGFDASGKRIKYQKTIHARTKKEAETELARFVAEVEAGTYIKPEKMAFGAFVQNEWLPKYAEKRYSPRNLSNIMYNVQAYILPAFAHLEISKIKTLHIESFFDRLDREPGVKGELLSGAAKANIYKVLKSIFSKAHEWRVISQNPISGVKPPRAERKQASYFTTEEVKDVLAALAREEDHWRLYFTGAILGGFRRGELVALEWHNVDWEQNAIHIKQSISLKKNGEAVIGPPKWGSSGKVLMPKWFMDDLRSYYKQWIKHRIEVGNKWKGGDHQFVFHNGLGEPYHPDRPTHKWRKIVRKYNLKPIRLHDLRHTAATLLIEAGHDLLVVKERLRHTKASEVTERYAHVTDKVQRKAIEALENIRFENR